MSEPSSSSTGGADLATGFERARVLLRFRRPEAAERELRGVLAREPQDANSHALLAISLSARGVADEAVGSVGEAVRLAPDQWFPHYAAAFVFKSLGRTDEALRAVHQALDIDPRRPSLWEMLAGVHLRRREWRQAADAARQGLTHDAGNADLTGRLALSLAALADTPGAGADRAGVARESSARAAEALRLAPEEPLTHLAYGMASLVTHDPATAAQAFRETLRLDPGVDLARRQLLIALKRHNPLYRVVSGFVFHVRSGVRHAPLLALPLLMVLPPAVWSLWAADTVMTLWLMRETYPRTLLDREQSLAAMLSGGALGAGMVTLALAAALTVPGLVGVGVGALALVAVIQSVFVTRSQNGRLLLGGWAAAIALVLALAFAGTVGAEAGGGLGGLGWLMVPACLLSVGLPAILDRGIGD